MFRDFFKILIVKIPVSVLPEMRQFDLVKEKPPYIEVYGGVLNYRSVKFIYAQLGGQLFFGELQCIR